MAVEDAGDEGPRSSRDVELSDSERSRPQGGFASIRKTRLSAFQDQLGDLNDTMQSAILGPGARHGHTQPSLSYNPDWHCVRIGLAVGMESLPYKLTMALSIMFNMVILILETDERATKRTEYWEIHRSTRNFQYIPQPWMQTASYVLLMFYVGDLLGRMYVHRSSFFHTTANKFDFAIVSTDCLVLMLDPLQDLPSVAVLRVLRMLRIVRVLRSFLVFRELYLMLQGLVSAIRSIVFATFLIAVVLILWSIMAVEFVHMHNLELADDDAYGDCPELFCRGAFSSVWMSSLTFLKGIIAGDSWGQLAYPLIILRPTSSFVLLGSLLMVQLGLLNLIVAVIVDRAQSARENDEELMYTEKQEKLEASYRRLKALFDRMDTDGGGTLSLPELQESYSAHAEFREILDLMDIQHRDLELVFGILDKNGDDEVSYQEFVEQLHEMKTFNAHTLLIYIKHYSHSISETLDVIREDMAARHKDLLSLRYALTSLCASKPEGPDEPASSCISRGPTVEEQILADGNHTSTTEGRVSSKTGLLGRGHALKEALARTRSSDGLATPVAPDPGVEGVPVPYVGQYAPLPDHLAPKKTSEQKLVAHGEAVVRSIKEGLDKTIQVAMQSFIEVAMDCITSAAHEALGTVLAPIESASQGVSTVLDSATDVSLDLASRRGIKGAGGCQNMSHGRVTLLSAPTEHPLIRPSAGLLDMSKDAKYVFPFLNTGTVAGHVEASKSMESQEVPSDNLIVDPPARTNGRDGDNAASPRGSRNNVQIVWPTSNASVAGGVVDADLAHAPPEDPTHELRLPVPSEADAVAAATNAVATTVATAVSVADPLLHQRGGGPTFPRCTPSARVTAVAADKAASTPSPPGS